MSWAPSTVVQAMIGLMAAFLSDTALHVRCGLSPHAREDGCDSPHSRGPKLESCDSPHHFSLNIFKEINEWLTTLNVVEEFDATFESKRIPPPRPSVYPFWLSSLGRRRKSTLLTVKVHVFLCVFAPEYFVCLLRHLALIWQMWTFAAYAGRWLWKSSFLFLNYLNIFKETMNDCDQKCCRRIWYNVWICRMSSLGRLQIPFSHPYTMGRRRKSTLFCPWWRIAYRPISFMSYLGWRWRPRRGSMSDSPLPWMWTFTSIVPSGGESPHLIKHACALSSQPTPLGQMMVFLSWNHLWRMWTFVVDAECAVKIHGIPLIYLNIFKEINDCRERPIDHKLSFGSFFRLRCGLSPHRLYVRWKSTSLICGDRSLRARGYLDPVRLDGGIPKQDLPFFGMWTFTAIVYIGCESPHHFSQNI